MSLAGLSLTSCLYHKVGDIESSLRAMDMHQYFDIKLVQSQLFSDEETISVVLPKAEVTLGAKTVQHIAISGAHLIDSAWLSLFCEQVSDIDAVLAAPEGDDDEGFGPDPVRARGGNLPEGCVREARRNLQGTRRRSELRHR